MFPEKLNIYLSNDPAISLLGIYVREKKVYVHIENTYIQRSFVVLIIAKNWKQSKCPSSGKHINTLE